jgi:AAA+ ATPase superfamily predicted ATPase
LIIDELQKIGDLKIDGYLIYELFNLFIRLTKELHCCHVFAVTSDSLFIERVYNEAMLQGRCDYLLVDDFDYETTKGFLRKYRFSQEEIDLAWEYLGGKPVYLVGAVKNKHRLKEFCEGMLEDRFSVILYSLRRLEDKDRKLFGRVLELFKKFESNETVECDRISDEIVWTVKQNILFLNPRKRLLRPQSKLDLLAIRRILEVI